MKFNLKTISLGSLAALALIVTPLAMTHQGAHAEGGGNHQGPLEQLDLTEAQSTQIEAIRADARSQMQAILTPEQQALIDANDGQRGGWRSLDLTDEQRSQVRTIREATREEIGAVLTDEQRQELEAARQEGRGRHGGDRLAALNLTEAQSAQIEAIRMEARSQAEALLTDEQRAAVESSESPREAMRSLNLTDEQREQMRAIREASREQMSAVLTEEQRQQLSEGARRNGPGGRLGQRQDAQ